MFKSILKPIRHIIKFLLKVVLFLLSIFLVILLIVSFVDDKKLPTELIVFGILGICYLLFTLNSWAISSTKRVCPICKSENIELDSVKEIDRWLGKTKVREKMASGKIRERYVQCTKVKKRYTYCCQNPNCKHTYSEIREEEK